MTTPDDKQPTRTASSGATRTPPPRTRRGAPTSRSTFDDLDALDDLLLPEQKAALAEPAADAKSDRDGGRTAKRSSSTKAASDTPSSTKAASDTPSSTKPSSTKPSSTRTDTKRPPAGGTRGAEKNDAIAEAAAAAASVDVEPADTPVRQKRGAKPSTTRRGSTAGTRGAPPAEDTASDTSTKKAFDWDAPAATPEREATRARRTTSNRDATIAGTAAAAEVYGDPVEPEIAFEPSPAQRPARAKSAKRPERRFRQTVQKVDLWSVTKMALCFYVSAMGVLVVSLVALWVVADSAGIIDNVENFIGDLFSSEDFHFVSGQVLRGAVLVGVVLVALMVAFTIIAASFYNIFAELFGGVEVVIREEEQPPKR